MRTCVGGGPNLSTCMMQEIRCSHSGILQRSSNKSNRMHSSAMTVQCLASFRSWFSLMHADIGQKGGGHCHRKLSPAIFGKQGDSKGICYTATQPSKACNLVG